MAAKAELALRELLLMTGCVQPVKVESKGSRIFALCRELKGQTKIWLADVEKLLHLAQDNDIPLHLCRQYVLKDGHMVFGWHVAIDAKSAADLTRCLSVIRGAIDSLGPELGSESDLVVAALSEASPPAPHTVQVTSEASTPDANDESSEALPEEKFTPQQIEDLRVRREKYRLHTTASPRAPEPQVVSGIVALGSVDYKPQVVFRGRAKNSKNQEVPVIIEEMPLPYVLGEDMNVPNEKGRGATTLG